MSEHTQHKSFLKGAAILGLAGLMVQVMGAIYRIPLANIIGNEGMGYFQTAYPVYIFILVFSTNGAPAAISKMVSENIARENYGEAHRIFRVSFLLMFLLGVVTSLAVFLLARPIVNYFGDPGAYYSLAAIAPALLFVPIMSVFRGYFQGFQVMGPTAASQMVEQVFRVAFGLTVAVLLVPKGIPLAAAAASGAGSIGPIFATAFIAFVYLRMKRKKILPMDGGDRNLSAPEPGRSILLRMAKIAIPITIGVSIFPIMNMVDLLVVMRRLQAIGYSSAEANGLYGQLSGYSGPIVNLPQSLALALALSLVPAIAAAQSVGDRQTTDNNTRLALRTSMIIGVPCGLGIMTIPQQILDLIYPTQSGETQAAAECMFFLGLGVIFICVAQAMAGILQGLGKPGLSVVGIAAGAAVKYVVSYFLIGFKALNVSGAAIGTSVGLLVVAVLNYRYVVRETGTKHDRVLALVKPCLCGLVMTVVVIAISYGLGHFVHSRVVTLLSVAVAAAVYGLMLIKTKTILPEEVKLLPKGDKLYRLLEKLKLA